MAHEYLNPLIKYWKQDSAEIIWSNNKLGMTVNVSG